MKLRDKFLSGLQAILGQANRRITVAEGLRTLRCEVDQCDPMAAAVFEFVLESTELVQQASRSLCDRVNYLLEPISPIETDSEGCVVQMRSSPPLENELGRYYYELLLRRGGSVSLSRYEKRPGEIRTRVPVTPDDFSVTLDEILES